MIEHATNEGCRTKNWNMEKVGAENFDLKNFWVK